MRVVDDGAGIDGAQATAGHGLRNLAERAAALGGEFTAERRDGGGTWRRGGYRSSGRRAGQVTRYVTTIAVTMPNMPADPSAWPRMWQCHAHVPGRSAFTSTV